MNFFKKIKTIFALPLRLLREDWDWWKENWQDVNFRHQFFLVVSGFSIAGLIWGIFMYKDIVLANDKSTFIFPFHWIAILALAIFGGLGLGLAFFPKNKKSILKLILLGIPAWLIAFIIPAIFSYPWLWMIDAILFMLINLSLYGIHFFIPLDTIFELPSLLFGLKPSLMIALWSEFIFSGLLISLFYKIIFKTKFKSIIFNCAISFGLISLIAPIIGNSFGFYLFNSLSLAYLITFFLIAFVFSVYLFKAIKKDKCYTKDEKQIF